MLKVKLRELALLREKIIRLEDSIAADLRATLAGLPDQFGFTDVNAFIDALRRAHRRKSDAPRGQHIRRPRHGKRPKISDETREMVGTMVKADKTGAQIASSLGISLPSIYNIKKALGLVKSRK
jgi:hypothetical protein